MMSYVFTYNNLVKTDSEFITEDIFNNIVGLMYNKNNLKTIYDNYYSDSEIFIDENCGRKADRADRTC